MNDNPFDIIRKHLETLDADYGISMDGDDRIIGVLGVLKVIEYQYLKQLKSIKNETT